MPQSRAQGRLSLTVEKKQRIWSHQAVAPRQSWGLGMGCAVSTCRCGLCCEVLATAATALHFYRSLTLEERSTPDYVTSFLQPTGASATLPAGGPACAAPGVSYFSLISLFFQPFLCGLHRMCPCWRGLVSQPCFLFLCPNTLITCSLCSAAVKQPEPFLSNRFQAKQGLSMAL